MCVYIFSLFLFLDVIHNERSDDVTAASLVTSSAFESSLDVIFFFRQLPPAVKQQWKQFLGKQLYHNSARVRSPELCAVWEGARGGEDVWYRQKTVLEHLLL